MIASLMVLHLYMWDVDMLPQWYRVRRNINYLMPFSFITPQGSVLTTFFICVFDQRVGF